MGICSTLLLLTAGAAAQASAAGDPALVFSPRHYVCCRAAGPITVDGRLDDAAWEPASWTEDFVDIEGAKKPAPRFRTRAKMLWDDRYFYVAAELEEPDVWGTLTERDSVIFQDNDFEVFIDPDGDTHRYYELEMNALDTVWDLFLDRPYRDGGVPLFHWDVRGLETGVHVEGTLNRPGDRDEGWTVEIALPWAVLKACAAGGKAPSPGDRWRVNFSRVEWRVEVKDGGYVKVRDPKTGKPLPENNWVWSPQGLVNMHYPEFWGYVQFSGAHAGEGKEAFRPDADAPALWALRRVYYAERALLQRQGAFSTDLEILGLKGSFSGTGAPEIRCTWSLFEARLRRPDGGFLHIDQGGRTWRTGP